MVIQFGYSDTFIDVGDEIKILLAPNANVKRMLANVKRMLVAPNL